MAVVRRTGGVFAAGVAAGALLTVVVVGVVGLPGEDCSAVREEFLQLRQGALSVEEVAELVGLAEQHPECFGPSELDAMPAAPADAATTENSDAAMAAAEAACARRGPTATGDPHVEVTSLPEGFVQRDTAVDTGSYAGFWDPLEPDGTVRDQVEALLVEGEWDPAGRHLAVTSVSGPAERLCDMMRHGARRPEASPLEVRDRHGLMFGNVLVWIEQPGLMIQLLGNDSTDGDFRTVAEGLDIQANA
jgi:hypothetical protein